MFCNIKLYLLFFFCAFVCAFLFQRDTIFNIELYIFGKLILSNTNDARNDMLKKLKKILIYILVSNHHGNRSLLELYFFKFRCKRS